MCTKMRLYNQDIKCTVVVLMYWEMGVYNKAQS